MNKSQLLLLFFSTTLLSQVQSKERFSKYIDRENPGHRYNHEFTNRYEVVPQALEKVDLPENWSWGNVDGVNYLTNIKNQHIPNYCGSCWAQASSSSISDRIKILRKAAWPDINIAPQVLISCEQFGDLGCNGGEPMLAFQWIYENYITDETCSPYRARGWDNGYGCSNTTLCKACQPHEPCYVPDDYNIYQLEGFGGAIGEEAMMQEVYQRGPIACGVAVPESLENYTGGIYWDQTNDTEITHDVSVVGFGVEDGVKYWVVRNSWGTHWGESGYFRVIRGINNIMIESNCSYAVPKDTWTNKTRHHTTDAEKADPNNDFNNSQYPIESASSFLQKKEERCRVKNTKFSKGERVTKPRPWEKDHHHHEHIPSHWDWRNVNNRNYLSWTRTQMAPVFCGSCWALAATSTIADRFNILQGDLPAALESTSAQMVINCKLGGGDCSGGDPAAVFEYAHTDGLPDSSCMTYLGRDLLDGHSQCEEIDRCRDCSPPSPPANEFNFGNCYAVTNYKRFYINDYYKLSGASNMKAEIYANGPISCGMYLSPNLIANYTGGIYHEHVDDVQDLMNHEVSVVGFSVCEKTGTEYWIVRNTMGTIWGDMGFFYLQMHTDNLGIESECLAGEPTFEKPSSTATSYQFTQ